MAPWLDQIGFRMAWPLAPFDPAPVLQQVRALESADREVVYAALSPSADAARSSRWRINVLTRRLRPDVPTQPTDLEVVGTRIIGGSGVQVFRAVNRFYAPCRLIDRGIWGELSRIAAGRFVATPAERTAIASALRSRIQKLLPPLEHSVARGCGPGSPTAFCLRTVCAWALLADEVCTSGLLPTQPAWERLLGMRRADARRERLAILATTMAAPRLQPPQIVAALSELRKLHQLIHVAPNTNAAARRRREQLPSVDAAGRAWLSDAVRGQLHTFTLSANGTAGGLE